MSTRELEPGEAPLGTSPVARLAARAWARLSAFDVPDTLATRVLFGSAYAGQYLFVEGGEWARSKFLLGPMLRARCARAGSRLELTSAPRIHGRAKISIGDRCTFSAFSLDVGSAEGEPEISFGDDCFVCSGVRFTLHSRITIGNHVGIASLVEIRDADGYSADPARRMRGQPMEPSDFAAVTLQDYAWIGYEAQITKGVTVGRGAIVGAGSVVLSDVPDGAIAFGVPARIIRL